MKKHDLDTEALKLHLDPDGIVWYCQGDRFPVCSFLSLSDFLSDPLSNHGLIRIIGSHNNVPLILQLVDNKPGRLQVCTPRACFGTNELQNPALALLRARNVRLTSSTGGWHDFTSKDKPSYVMAQRLMENNGRGMTALLKEHPAWGPVSFIPHLNPKALWRLIGLVIDPRWFVNQKNVNRGSTMRRYLGLDPHTMRGVMREGPRRPRHARCKLVYDCWNVKLDKKESGSPGCFLHRVVVYNGREDLSLGLLRASQKFVDFLRLTWSALLNADKVQHEPLFAADCFFKRDDEVQAFTDHMGRFQ